MKRLLPLVLALALALAMAMTAAARPIVYRDGSEEQRFRSLTSELRCVMCQNQSLADSSAPIAHDLRLEVLRLMREGKSDAQIKRYLVARYSDFVLYKPEVRPMTWLLWFGPGVLILAGGVAIVLIVRRHGRGAPASPPTNDSQEW
jgi:cytochrome c-type biogenesis protein CcmH